MKFGPQADQQLQEKDFLLGGKCFTISFSLYLIVNQKHIIVTFSYVQTWKFWIQFSFHVLRTDFPITVLQLGVRGQGDHALAAPLSLKPPRHWESSGPSNVIQLAPGDRATQTPGAVSPPSRNQGLGGGAGHQKGIYEHHKCSSYLRNGFSAKTLILSVI